MAHEWSASRAFMPFPSEIDRSSTRSEGSLNWPGQRTANAIYKTLLVVELPVVRVCSDG